MWLVQMIDKTANWCSKFLEVAGWKYKYCMFIHVCITAALSTGTIYLYEAEYKFSLSLTQTHTANKLEIKCVQPKIEKWMFARSFIR